MNLTFETIEKDRIRLVGDATVHNAEPLYNQLESMNLNNIPLVTIDLSGITQMDVAGAQILIAFKQSGDESRNNGCRVVYEGRPEPCYTRMKRAGLSAPIWGGDHE